MDVFLLPVGPDRYELYCEVEDPPHGEDPEAEPRGFFRGLKVKFTAMLAEAERERREGRKETDQPRGWLGRAKSRMTRWVAESIAEQRLLWTLRNRTEARLHYPSDMGEADAVNRLRAQLGRDFDKHQFWVVVHSLLFIASGLLAILPGPNVIAYYFAFRMVGHFLSLRGARQSLGPLSWSYTASVPLAELREAVGLEPPARRARVEAVAAALGLEHLPRFFDRTAAAA